MRTLEKWESGPYWDMERITKELKISRSAAYKLIAAAPEHTRVLIISQERGKLLFAARRDVILAMAKQRRPRGNPRFKDPAFQAEQARKRHEKK